MFRVIVVLLGTVIVMLTAVVLRAETARLNHEISGLDREELRLREEARGFEIELARLRNPMLMRQRVAENRLQQADGATNNGTRSAGAP